MKQWRFSIASFSVRGPVIQVANAQLLEPLFLNQHCRPTAAVCRDYHPSEERRLSWLAGQRHDAQVVWQNTRSIATADSLDDNIRQA
jgi:hypothetical protein